jgi:hypothetical protein
MAGVEIVAPRGLSCLPGGTTRPRALAGMVVAHDPMRAEAGRTAQTRTMVTRPRQRHR